MSIKPTSFAARAYWLPQDSLILSACLLSYSLTLFSQLYRLFSVLPGFRSSNLIYRRQLFTQYSHLYNMMKTTQEATPTQTLSDNQSSVPPYSPISWEPITKHPYPFDTEFSRDPDRVRTVFDTFVEKTKEMNNDKPETYSGKRRAQNLGLKVDIGQAKGLHWRSIQARQPVVLTACLDSPPRTPRRPATEYPSAELLYLKNMVDAQKNQNYLESCRWSVFAERERAISQWEAEQAEVARQANVHEESDWSNDSSQTDTQRPELSMTGRNGTIAPGGESWTPTRSDSSTSSLFGSTNSYREGDMPQNQPIVELPGPLIDGSQSLRSDPKDGHFSLARYNQTQAFPSACKGDTPVRLSRNPPMHRHIPPTSLKMAPTPILPRIDRHPVSYPLPQATKLSYIQPSNTSFPSSLQDFSDTFPYSVNRISTSFSSSQSTAPSGQGPIGSDDVSIMKKRRTDTEHSVTSRRKLQ
ncbi:hypothetical protein DFH11DRAFT_1613040 [Phellopilus nigrolimitatus]|nr:hypothetical protein DFH11DRAFT_1613040 [Phellopilus nigrolimitatus]